MSRAVAQVLSVCVVAAKAREAVDTAGTDLGEAGANVHRPDSSRPSLLSSRTQCAATKPTYTINELSKSCRQ